MAVAIVSPGAVALSWLAGWVSGVTVVSATVAHLARLLRKVADEVDDVWDEFA